MKSRISNLVFFFLITILFSCRPTPSNQVVKGNSLNRVADTYKPPVFADDDRALKIKDVATEIQQLMADHAEAQHIPGIAYGIVVDDQLVLSSAKGLINLATQATASPQSVFRIASMTKSFTAMAIMKLRDEGLLSLTDPVSRHIPETSELAYLTVDAPAIDIENLLTMTAGFPEDNPWGDRQLDETDEMLMNLVSEGLSFSSIPSTAFEYSNTAYALLGHIVTQLSGMPFQEYIRTHILLPLGMNRTYWEYSEVPEDLLALGYRWEDAQWKPEPMLHDGVFGAMGGLITTIEDFSKYVSFHLSAWPPGSSEDNGLVLRSTLREMHTPQYARLYVEAKDFNGEPCAVMSGYGYGLGIATDCHGLKRISHGGALPGFGSNYVFYPEYGVGLMAFGNLTYTSPWPFNDLAKILFETLDLKPRVLPASDILVERQGQLVAWLQQWDTNLEADLLAENFYPDRSRVSRKAEWEEIRAKAGAISEVEQVIPRNQLRGRFKMLGKEGDIDIFFTLTPEKDPKVQQLGITFEPKVK